LGLLFLLVASVVALLVGILLTSEAAQAQGLLDGAQGEVQQTAGAPAAPAPERQVAPVQEAAPLRQPEPATLDSTQQTTAPISASASEPVQGQALAPIQQQAAPGTVQETVAPAAEPVSEPVWQTVGQTTGAVAQTAEPVTAPVKQTTEPVGGMVQQSAEPVVDTINQTTYPAQERVDPVTRPVLETVNQTTEAGAPVVQPVVDTVEETAEPLLKPVLKPVQETVEPAVKPVQQTVEPVLGTVEDTAKPVLDTVDPVVQPLKDTVDPVVAPVKETIDPVVATTHRPDELFNQRPEPTGAATIEALVGPAQQATEPGVGATLDPVLRTESSPGVAPVLKEGAVRAGEGISLGASSGPLAANMIPDDFLGSSARGLTPSARAPAGTVVTGTEGSVTSSFSMGVSTGEYASILDYLATTTARGSQDGLPRPSPFPGAIPVGPAGSSSSGLGASSGGLGFGWGALAVVLMLCALYGRFLLPLRNFLRPTSALVLAIERPG
jgi:hypothetical protein